MFRSLLQEASTPISGRHRSLIEALFGMKCDNSNESSDSTGNIEWTWESAIGNDFVYLLNNNRDVKFHRNFSSGTAVVRGNQPMSHDQYFWEVKMISPVYGTDMMIGIGTSDADMSQVHDKFISLLGVDNQTWGLSYTGLFHHNGMSRDYSTRFGQGSVIGVHLDLWNGTLSYYKNKKYLGVASRGLKGKTLYAMASSTAACSGMRIVRACSFPSSLQFLCCTKLRELIPDKKNVLKAIDFPPGLRLFLANNLSWLLESRYAECLVHHYMPKRKRHWAFGIESTNDSLGDFWYENGDEETEAEADNSDSTENKGEESFVLIGNQPFILRECNRIQRSSAASAAEGGESETARSEREHHSLGEELLNSAEGSTNSVVELDKSYELVDPMEDHDKSLEKEVKRRRCSYNYAMGLSDPDSD